MNRNYVWLALTGVLTLAACSQNNTPAATPQCSTGQTLVGGVCTATTGALVISNPNGYTVTVTNSAGQTVPAASYAALAPGTYTVAFSREGYTTQTAPATITAGQTTTVVAPTLVMGTRTAYYVNGSGALTPVPANAPATAFRFVAWAQNLDGGVNVTNTNNMVGVNGTPTAAEQAEVAPLNRQNVLGAYMSYTPDGTNFFPVVGADVRWDITEQTGSVRFSAADDGPLDSGAVRPQDINANGLSALTWTNRAAGAMNTPYPSASTAYPLYNLTGVGTPDTNGYTWATLNHDPAANGATARVRVVGYINGTEIDKQWLSKTFAPSANLTLTKESNQESTPGAPRTFRITVRNSGQGPATDIRLSDVLATGDAALYSATAPAGTTTNATDGFDATFDLAAGESRSFEFQAQASDAGQFCDVATVASYVNGPFGTVTPGVTPGQDALRAQACLTVRAPRLTVVKTLVDAAGNPLNDQTVVAAGQDVQVRITLTNGGDLAADGVVLTDVLRDGAAASYSLGAVTPAAGVTANGDDGFTTAAQTIAPGASVSYTFPARASADGRYCDVASFTSTNAGTGSDDACFTVATARLNITKTNAPDTNLFPGSTYTSTITVSNTGTAAATNVNVRDVIGNNATYGYVTYGSASYTVTGTAQQGSVTFADNTATIAPATVTIPAGGQLVMTVTSSIPASARAGQYCNVASFSSANSQPTTGQATACVTVNSFIGQQTQLTDTVDPLRIGQESVLAAAAIVEPASNQGAKQNVFFFNLGTRDPSNFQTGGVFTYRNVEFYYDPSPARDNTTGAIVSDYRSATSTRITPTLSADTGTGAFRATLPADFVIAPGAVVWIRVPFAATTGNAGQYQEVFRWENVGQDDNAAYINQKAESTTIIP